MRRPSLVLGLFASVLAASIPLSAHDFWIEPTGFTADLGRIVGVKLRVGQDFHGDPVPRGDALIGDFVVVDAAGRRPVVGRDGSDPAGLLRGHDWDGEVFEFDEIGRRLGIEFPRAGRVLIARR